MFDHQRKLPVNSIYEFESQVRLFQRTMKLRFQVERQQPLKTTLFIKLLLRFTFCDLAHLLTGHRKRASAFFYRIVMITESELALGGEFLGQ